MSIYLDVPFVTQLGIGAHVDPSSARDDPTGCWYASACMVGYYFEAGPRLGNPDKFKRPLNAKIHGASVGHETIGGAAEAQMMANEGLEEVPEPSGKQWEGANLSMLLKEHGPLMMSWYKPYGHVSVIVGFDSATNEVIYHDPEGTTNSRMSLGDFNAKLMWGQRALMRRQGQPHIRG